jgi:pSer/pThr/pTyr-binding forkhead associated (FHA) protein
MSYRLLVNPGTPQAWEILLQPGINRVGRDEENDFTLNHESVSGAHCEITVNNAGVFLKDLGSTNGTFVNRAPVTAVQLKPGQNLQIGQVAMVLEAESRP